MRIRIQQLKIMRIRIRIRIRNPAFVLCGTPTPPASLHQLTHSLYLLQCSKTLALSGSASVTAIQDILELDSYRVPVSYSSVGLNTLEIFISDLSFHGRSGFAVTWPIRIRDRIGNTVQIRIKKSWSWQTWAIFLIRIPNFSNIFCTYVKMF